MIFHPKRFLRDASGHFAMMTAIMAPVAITLAAFAIDAGAIYTEKRRAQALADLAAVTAAANLDRPQLGALTAMADNGVGDIVLAGMRADGSPDFSAGAGDDQIFVVPGRYVGDTSRTANSRFAAAATPSNAVKVVYRTKGPRFFAGAIIPAPEIVVTSLAASESSAAFSVGSRLAALNGGLVNSLLGGLTGSSLSLSVMDYNALLDADVNLLSFIKALAVDLDLTAATFDDVLDAEVTVGQVAGALSASDGLDGVTKAAANRLRQQASGSPTFRLSRMIDLGILGEKRVDASVEQLGLDVGVMDLVMASAIASGRGHQVALDLGATLPGLLSVTVALAIGEPPQSAPWFAYAERQGIVRTAQTRLSVVAEIGGLGGLLGTKIRVPLYLELAFAEAKLSDVECPSGQPSSLKVMVDARPGVADLYLADVNAANLADFSKTVSRSPARLVTVPLVGISASAHAEIANTQFKQLVFAAAEIGNGTIKQVSTQQALASLSQSLFSSLSVEVKAVGLGLGLPAGLTGTVGNLVSGAAPALDAALFDILATLGISVGQADVQVHAASCGRPVLVQ